MKVTSKYFTLKQLFPWNKTEPSYNPNSTLCIAVQYFFVQLIGWAVTTQLISFSAGLLVISRRQLSRVPCLKSQRTTAPGCRYVGRECNLYQNKIKDKLVQATQLRDGKTSPNLTASLDSKSELALWIVSHCQVPSPPQSFSFLPFFVFSTILKICPIQTNSRREDYVRELQVGFEMS